MEGGRESDPGVKRQNKMAAAVVRYRFFTELNRPPFSPPPVQKRPNWEEKRNLQKPAKPQ